MSPLATGLGVTLGTTALLLWLVERHAPGLGLMDIPNDRSSHSRPTPRGGGIAIVLGSVAGLCVSFAMRGTVGAAHRVAALTAASLVAFVSLVDDVRSLPAAIRLTAHIAAAAAIIGQLPLPRRSSFPASAWYR